MFKNSRHLGKDKNQKLKIGAFILDTKITIKNNKNYYVVRNAGFARSRNT